MKLTIKETLRPLYEDVYITSDPMDIAKKFAKGNEAFRVLYDAQSNFYMIGDAWKNVHSDLLHAAFFGGWYESQKDFIADVIGYYRKGSCTDYFCRGLEGIELDDEDDLDLSKLNSRVDTDEHTVYPWLYCCTFLPIGSGQEERLTKDGYNHTYEYPFGTLFTRDFELNETPDLERALNKLR